MQLPNVGVGKYAKLVVAGAGAAAVAAQTAITDGFVSPNEWVTIALAVLAALGVYRVPNKPEPEVKR